MGTHRTIPGTTENRKMHLGKANAISSLAGLFTTDAGVTHIGDPISTASRVVEIQGSVMSTCLAETQLAHTRADPGF